MLTQIVENQKMTYQNYLQWDSETLCEIIKGELTMTPSPSWKHQDISRNLETLLDKYVQEKSLGKIFDAPLDVVLDEHNVVQPDILYISRQNSAILQDESHAVMGIPELIIEIVSPSSFHRDVFERLGR